MTSSNPLYLDTAATTQVDPRVVQLVLELMVDEFGNAGSRTHEYGAKANRAVETARHQVALVVGADPAEVIFTSGATESDNLALIGLAEYGRSSGRMHIVTSMIEHKAVMEPLAFLETQGFAVDRVPVDNGGAVDVEDVLAAVRGDTLVVSVMQVNNETGVRQPISRIADGLTSSDVLLHTDAAQGFAKDIETLRHPRIDLISVSGHKIFAPKGVGALIARRRDRRRPPLKPLMYGGGQERGYRPGTLPVPLIAGFGLASELALDEAALRAAHAARVRSIIVEGFAAAGAVLNGDSALSVPHIVNLTFPGLDSEAVILALRDDAAISNGSACTSSTYEPSQVLAAMGLEDWRQQGAVRLSWSHATPDPDIEAMTRAIALLR